MEKQILQMKVTPPEVGPNIIERQRLIKEIARGLETEEGFNRKLTLISAPAGFGKTSLLANYYQQTERAACWLTLAEEDNSPSSLLLYLIATIRQVEEGFAQGIEGSLQSAVGFNNKKDELGREIVNRLLNELLELEQPIYLLIDELQEINSEAAYDLLTHLIDNLPSGVHIIAAGREMPSWPINRWRVEGKVRTIGQRELKFTKEETNEFLQQRGREVSLSESKILTTRTEGWIAGLQMISLLPSNLSVDEVEEMELPQEENHMFDYLLEEVLAEQEQEMQDFLLRTAALDKFNEELCSVVTDCEAAEEMLAEVARRRLFLQSVDRKQEWYRYHQLFAAALRRRLEREASVLKRKVHQRAAIWFEEQGLYGEAVEQSLTGEDLDRAARIIFENSGDFLRRGKQVALIRWLKEFPQNFLNDRLELRVVQGIFKLFAGELIVAKEIFNNLQHKLTAGKVNNFTTENEDLIEGMLAVGFVMLTKFQGQNYKVRENIKIAKENLPVDSYWRQLVTLIHGDMKGFAGDYTGAVENYRSVSLSSERDKSNFLIQLAKGKEAWFHWWAGYLQEAVGLYDNLLQSSFDTEYITSSWVGVIKALRGEVYCEQNNLTQAQELIEEGFEICNQAPGVKGKVVEFFINIIRLRYYFATKSFNQAQEIFESLQGLAEEELNVYLINFITAWQARFWLEPEYPADTGWKEALKLLSSRGQSPEKEPRTFQLLEYLVLGRVLLAGGRWEAVDGVLQDILDCSLQNDLPRMELESRLLLARLYDNQGKTTTVYEQLEQALDIAAYRGYFQTIVNEGKPITALLYRFNPDETKEELVSRLLNCMIAGDKTQGQNDLIEPLSDREEEILIEIAGGYSNQEIADRLHISLSTVKWHSSNIYGKLKVDNRTQAVERGRKLGILD